MDVDSIDIYRGGERAIRCMVYDAEGNASAGTAAAAAGACCRLQLSDRYLRPLVRSCTKNCVLSREISDEAAIRKDREDLAELHNGVRFTQRPSQLGESLSVQPLRGST